MKISICPDKPALGTAAAEHGARLIREAIAQHGEAHVVLATGASQFEMLEQLLQAEIEWSAVSFYHLDEYVGLPVTHGASFRRYLRERFLDRLPGYKSFLAINADAADLDAELARLNGALAGQRIDVCFAGIGENCHLAFNDPPADFDYDQPYLVVDLDAACRQQQFGEGWFETLEAVPTRAISMSIRRIMACEALILAVPDERKAKAVQAAVEGPVSNLFPASIVQQHPDAGLYLDPAAASLLRPVHG
ncbi:glucosamine-6-phosphate deaminase [Devosia sp. 1566]|uniref:glucosamine-6-phosphate deaminase n=1 Tax=Devosia sp. 1566 TaxID=2499144 RepID=UPI000FD8F943|nr:glucosamine-6-phosphate deaminase [Devosia sp. 1566]